MATQTIEPKRSMGWCIPSHSRENATDDAQNPKIMHQPNRRCSQKIAPKKAKQIAANKV